MPYYVAAMAGVWLFYVQHQFEDAYWTPHDDWDYVDAALRGSSHLRLSPVLQWFTGSIGLHHVHHVAPTHSELSVAAVSRRERAVSALTRRDASLRYGGVAARPLGRGPTTTDSVSRRSH